MIYLALLATVLRSFSFNATTAARKAFSKKWRLHISYEKPRQRHTYGI
jgi:hypothetical protein